MLLAWTVLNATWLGRRDQKGRMHKLSIESDLDSIL